MIIMWLPLRCSPSRWSEEGTPFLSSGQQHIIGVVEQTLRGLRGPPATPEPSSRLAAMLGSKMSRVLCPAVRCPDVEASR